MFVIINLKKNKEILENSKVKLFYIAITLKEWELLVYEIF